MIAKYSKQGTIAAFFCVASIFGIGAVAPFWPQGLHFLLGVFGVLFSFTFWSFARAKGYSGFLGVALSALTLVGLIVLAKLPDRNPRTRRQTAPDAQQAIQGDGPASGGPAP